LALGALVYLMRQGALSGQSFGQWLAPAANK
jgi:hypothetical protein